jgi:hypothetical protein
VRASSYAQCASPNFEKGRGDQQWMDISSKGIGFFITTMTNFERFFLDFPWLKRQSLKRGCLKIGTTKSLIIIFQSFPLYIYVIYIYSIYQIAMFPGKFSQIFHLPSGKLT